MVNDQVVLGPLGSPDVWPQALGLLGRGRVRPSALVITHRYPQEAGVMTTVSPTLQCSTRSEMIDLRVVGWRCWANRPDPRAVTTTIPDDLWPEALAAPPEPGFR